MNVCLAIDLGAGSGRLMAVTFDGKSVGLETVHRFESAPLARDDGLYWDLDGIWREIDRGLGMALDRYGRQELRSIGVDSWGVDYAWLGEDGNLLGPPRCYRDPRSVPAMAALTAAIGREAIFAETGIQFMPINSLYQLRADLDADPRLPERAACFLMIADLIHHRLTGVCACERTNASTTQMYNPRTRTWSRRLTEAAGLPDRVLPPLIDPATVIGEVKAGHALAGLPVVAVGSHDTASAVAAIPAVHGRPFAYLSCGTWALLGTETRQPALSKETLNHNFTNETGLEGSFRLLKNITGLWIIQECRRHWQEEAGGRPLSYTELAAEAAEAPGLRAFIDPDATVFAGPGDHPEAIRAFCRRTGQPVPVERGEVLRVAVESLALKAAHTLDQLESLLNREFEVLHVIGGGANHALLMQCLANATGRPVRAGPDEATALGNGLAQLMATGLVSSLREARKLVASSIEMVSYEPIASWVDARRRYAELLQHDASLC